VSSQSYGVNVFINVCRDIKFNDQVPGHRCSDGSTKTQPSPACRTDIGKPIGKITSLSRLHYMGNKIKLNYTIVTKDCPVGVVTDITFLCQKQFLNVSKLTYSPVRDLVYTAQKPPFRKSMGTRLAG
jgi:hypothetical protein